MAINGSGTEKARKSRRRWRQGGELRAHDARGNERIECVCVWRKYVLQDVGESEYEGRDVRLLLGKVDLGQRIINEKDEVVAIKQDRLS